MASPDRLWLSAEEAAHMAGVTPQYLYRRRRDGLPPIYYRIGGWKVQYKRSDVEDWINSGRFG